MNSCSIYSLPRQANEILKSREIREEPAYTISTLSKRLKRARAERRERVEEERLTRTFNDQ